jgi:hypothetical protein
MLTDFHNADYVLQVTLKLFAFLSLIRNVEYLFLYRQFEKDGMLGWPVFCLKNTRSIKFADKYLGSLFNYKTTISLFIITLVFYLFILLGIGKSFFLFFLIVILLFNMLFSYRNSIGREGADYIHNILCFSLLIVFLFKNQKLIEEYSLIFIAVQALFSYWASGMFKLISPAWRNGIAIYTIFNLKTWGNRRLSIMVERNNYWLGKIFSWLVILLLVLTPFSTLLSPAYCMCFLAGCAIFHLANAFIMGLNKFFWAFIATYPAIIYLCTIVSLKVV